ncbi:MAG: glutamate--tRNA ligase family protein [Terracidiphilus sp.]|jgi:glutamyl-tRNA synthetase
MASHFSLPQPSYRGRLAPSPTGYLHVGHARTFWTAFERASDAGGTLVMRMEDLDPERSRAEYAEAALEDLRWLGIHWQEGPDMSGPCAPYEQSGRRAVHLAAWRKLLRGGFLFPCRCSRKDLEAALSAPHEGATQGNGEQEPLDDEPVYPGTCRPDTDLCSRSPTLATEKNRKDGARDGILRTHYSMANEIEEPGNFNWRFRVPDGEAVEFEDRNLGPQRFVAGVDFGDFVVWRRDGVPSYQLACVADDAAMQITEVVRGEDLLKSTARQILLYRALGLETPDWFHCRLAVDKNGHRLAKRHDALSLRTLRQRGVTPEQILSAELPDEA